MATVFPRDFITEERQVGMPEIPHWCSRRRRSAFHKRREDRPHEEEGELSSRVREDVSGIGERNFVAVGVGRGLILSKTDGELGHHLEGRPAPPQKFQRRSSRGA